MKLYFFLIFILNIIFYIAKTLVANFFIFLATTWLCNFWSFLPQLNFWQCYLVTLPIAIAAAILQMKLNIKLNK